MISKLTPWLLAAGIALSFTTQAGSPDQVLISADKQQARLKPSVGIFQHNVEVIHGNRTIKADLLEAHRRAELGENKQLLIASGNPAVYTETLDDGTVITASAKEIRYDVATAMLTIIGDAKITQAGQQIAAETITYDINQQLITAEKDKDSSQRVHTILIPADKQEKQQP